jgi:regulator of sirC expression with transglutaminase-like and TPR domain
MNELSEKELNALVSLLDDTDSEVKFHVRKKLISLGREVIPFLEKSWEQAFNADIQREIEDLVHTLQFEQLKERLTDWVNSPHQDLLTGLWIINTYQYPDLTLEKLTAELGQIYYQVWTEFKNDLTPFEQVQVLNNVLFSNLKFSANTKNFHSPANSMLSSVLATKKGNPISLCCIYLLVAQKLGLPIYGVNLPNLFVLTYKGAESSFYINAFNKGMIFQKSDLINYMEHLKIEPQEMFFNPCSSIEIVLRYFRNLILSFEKLGEIEKVEELKELFSIIDDNTVG